jgi:CheY-like chemotaxis protein
MDVLVVESARLVRQLLVELIEEAGLPPASEAADVDEALAMLAGQPGVVPAVLVVGVHPPGASRGREMARLLSEGRGPAPALLHVGPNPALLGVETLEERERLLVPPFGAATLAHAVMELMGRPAPNWLRNRPAPEPDLEPEP